MYYKIYVIANADLFKESFNAIAAFCNSSVFKGASLIGSLIGIVMTFYAYLRGSDLSVFLKYLVPYMLVSHVLLGYTVSVNIINTSDSTKVYSVDNVPFGIAYPAHLITAIGYFFTQGIETVFSLPEERQYHKTGMLFGSDLFQLSLSSTLEDPEVTREMNSYVRSCVIGDIMINHKYTFKDLNDSKDLWGLITKNPSPIRGVFVDGKFKTCKEEAISLTGKIDKYIEDEAPGKLSKYIASANEYTSKSISSMLSSSFNYFQSASKTASDILKQNISINAFRSGLKNYAAEVGSVAGMENINNTLSMMKLRLSWANSRHLGVKTLPMMQVVLLLLMICSFPIISVIAMIPGMSQGVLKNYIYSLIWIETWPILYAILNMSMNFYLQSKGPGTVTLSNINHLAQEHSDVAGMAGYLVLAIPFLSMGVVKGMASTFNSAAQYLGGMMHSIAQGTSTGVAMGNYSLGNVSTDNATANNLSANKHDTNFTDMSGMATTQLSNGSLMTQTASGANVYNTHGAMSQLATRVDFARGISNNLTQRADSSVTSAVSDMVNYSQSKGHNDSLGTGVSTSERADVNQSINHNISMAQTLAKKEGISVNDAYSKLHQASLTLGAKGALSVEAKYPGMSPSSGAASLGASASLGGSAHFQAGQNHAVNSSTGVDKNISQNDARTFAENESKIRSYSKNHTYSSQNTDAENLVIQASQNLNKATSLSESAQYVQSNSASINTNMAQEVVDRVSHDHPGEAASILSATSGEGLVKQKEWVQDAISNKSDEIASQGTESMRGIQRGHGPQSMVDMHKYAVSNYDKTRGSIIKEHEKLGLSQDKVSEMKSNVENRLDDASNHISKEKEKEIHDKRALGSEVDSKISKEKAYAEEGVMGHALDWFHRWKK